MAYYLLHHLDEISVIFKLYKSFFSGINVPLMYLIAYDTSPPKIHHDALRWSHNERDGVSNHHPHDCLLNRQLSRRSKKTSKLRAIGLCEGNSPVTGEFPAQRASNAENVYIWWCYHGIIRSKHQLKSGSISTYWGGDEIDTDDILKRFCFQ